MAKLYPNHPNKESIHDSEWLQTCASRTPISGGGCDRGRRRANECFLAGRRRRRCPSPLSSSRLRIITSLNKGVLIGGETGPVWVRTTAHGLTYCDSSPFS